MTGGLPVNHSHVHAQFFNMIKMMFSFPKPNQKASRSHIDLFHAGMGILTSAFMAINIIFEKEYGIFVTE